MEARAAPVDRRAAGFPRRHAGHSRLSQRPRRLWPALPTAQPGKLRAPKGECFLDLADLLANREGLLLIVMPPARTGRSASRCLKSWAGHLAGGVHALYRRGPPPPESADRAWRATARVPLIAVNDVLYHHPEQRAIAGYRHLHPRACDPGEAGTRLEANAERHLKPPAEMARLFRAWPEAIAETLRFRGRASLSP